MPNKTLRLVQIQTHNQKKLLVRGSVAKSLQEFLVEICQNNVLVINTNLMLDVYYLSEYNHSSLIEESFLLLSAKESLRCTFTDFDSEEASLQRFESMLIQLAHYPQTFLAYCKKVAFRLKRDQINPEIVLKLIGRFNKSVDQLKTNGKAPHEKMLRNITNNFKEALGAINMDVVSKDLLADWKRQPRWN